MPRHSDDTAYRCAVRYQEQQLACGEGGAPPPPERHKEKAE
jgi:hypothetical protein